MPPLAILNGRAFLVSPLEAPAYLLELPDLKEDLLEGEIRKRLRTLYPGAPEDTEIDYALCPRTGKTAPRTALARAIPRETGAMYRGLRRPLVPGTAIMDLAMARAGIRSALCVILTEEWVEAAFFEDRRILRYGSCPAASSGGLPFISSFVNRGESRQTAALLIRAGSSAAANEETEKLLLQFFERPRIFDIDEIAAKKNLKNLGIFNDSRRLALERRRRSAGALLLLNGLSLLLSLRGLSERTKTELSRMEKQEQEQGRALDRARDLEKEIAGLLDKGAEDPQDRADPYGIIAGIQRCLSGGWIRSLVIQGENFDLEAEGADSIAVLQSLQTAGTFSELSLRRAADSPVSGDQFLISGRTMKHGKK
jgi:hypothetical protein